MKICQECGTPCNDDTVFCYICGSKFHMNNLKIDSGYESEYFATDSNTMTAILDNPAILISDKDITTVYDILPLLEESVNSGCQLVIIAGSFEKDVIATLLTNKLRGILACAAITAPEHGDKRKDILEDIAILSGGQVISSDYGFELKDTTLSLCGKAKTISITKDETVIIGGNGDELNIKQRVSQLKERISPIESDDGEFIKNRLINLFGLTESEVKNLS